MFETSFIELDSSIYAKNLAFLKKTVAANSQLCSVIKGNAYGHGDREFLQMAQREGVRIFAVFNAQEALRLQPLLYPESRLIIMGDIHFPELPWAIEKGVEFYVHNLELLDETISVSQKMGIPALVHIELETGMHRLGIEKYEYEILVKKIKENLHCIQLVGICTHFAGSESISNYLRIKKQHKAFESALKFFRTQDLGRFDAHAACSAAAIRMKNTRYDMVRIGILQYGLWPSQEAFIDYVAKKKDQTNPLEGIISWKSRVMAVKNVPIGSFVGYGNSYLTESHEKIAVVPVGYSNGFARALSNQGRVLIHGKRVSVAGTVNMNAITIDVTNLPNVQIGDEVVLIGKQQGQSITVSSFGDYSNQLNYELLTRLPMDIPRIIK